MKSVNKILKELASSSSGNLKKEILLKNKDNTELMKFFELCLDKSINYYIKKIPNYNKNHTGEVSLKKAMDSLSKLGRRVFTGNKAKFFISKLLTSCSFDDAEVIKKILKRDPNCGVSYKTVNKIWNDLIFTWPCLLCERSTRKNLDNICYPALSQEKADGIRFNIIYNRGKIEYRSRNGKYINLHEVLNNQIVIMAKYIPYDNFVVDGEGLIITLKHINTPSYKWGKYLEEDLFENRKTGNGIFSKGIQNTITEEEAERIRIKVWDVIPYEEFMSRKGTVPYKNRITIIKKIITKYPEKFDKIALTLTKIVNDENEAIRFYEKMISLGKEGSILKNINSLFEDKRSKDQVKLKITKDLDMVVIATYPHKKKKNQIGGLTVMSSDGKVKCNVGSGLKDDDRNLDPIKYINKIVVIQANGIIKSKIEDSKYSLFLPIYKDIRFDKDEADTYEDIVQQFDSI